MGHDLTRESNLSNSTFSFTLKCSRFNIRLQPHLQHFSMFTSRLQLGCYDVHDAAYDVHDALLQQKGNIINDFALNTSLRA